MAKHWPGLPVQASVVLLHVHPVRVAQRDWVVMALHGVVVALPEQLPPASCHTHSLVAVHVADVE
jgi:hypothetical protein